MRRTHLKQALRRKKKLIWAVVIPLILMWLAYVVVTTAQVHADNDARVTREIKQQYGLDVIWVGDTYHYVQWVTADKKQKCTGNYDNNLLSVDHCIDLVLPR